MAIDSANQYRYTGKGPLDSKALVKTFADLLLESTWQVTNSSGKEVITAYNGMIVAVWLDKDENKNLTNKNGIYFLFDGAVTGTLGIPDVTDKANWHKLGGINDLPGLNEQIVTIQTELENVKGAIEELQDSATVVIEPGQQLPEVGLPRRLYVVLEEATTYVWYNNDYLPVGDCTSSNEIEIQVIHGGSAK